MKNDNFIDELLKEAEQKEQQDTQAYFDLLILEIKELEYQKEENNSEAEKEVRIIQEWAVNRNAKLDNQISYRKRQLEEFVKREGEKTVELPHGTLKLHKKPDKVEICDMSKFLANAREETINRIPEQIKPDLNKIKTFIKRYGYTPSGVKMIEGKEEFSLKIKKEE